MNHYSVYASQRSPFARRVRFLLARLKLPHEVEFMDVFKHNPKLFEANPLGLVPVLVTPDAGPIVDSAAILEYLNEKTGQVWPQDPLERVKARQVSVLCQGVMQNIVNYFLETAHHEVPSQEWANEFKENIIRVLNELNKMKPETWEVGGGLTQGAWDLGVALDYLVMRVPEIQIGKEFPKLYAVLQKCNQNSTFVETAPKA